MLFQRLIPSLLLMGKRLVKGVRFADYRDAGNPATTARAHNHQSADELFVCDIEASRLGRGPDLEVIGKIADECFMPLTVGGGIHSLDVAGACMETGADKLCLTGTALDRPELIEELAACYGTQAVVVGIDVVARPQGGWQLYDYRTAQTIADRDPFAWAKEVAARGAGEIRLMAVDREGTRTGYDLGLYEKMRQTVALPIVLEGGAGSLNDIEAAFRAGVDGIAVGAMLVFADHNLVKIKQHLVTRECNVRP